MIKEVFFLKGSKMPAYSHRKNKQKLMTKNFDNTIETKSFLLSKTLKISLS